MRAAAAASIRPRPLSALERRRYAGYVDPLALERARIVDGRTPFWLRPDMGGVTVGDRIWLRPGAYDAASAAGIELLGHELVHVEQFLRGMTVAGYLWACRRGYRANPYEQAAYARAAVMRAAWLSANDPPLGRIADSPQPSLAGVRSIDRPSASAASMPSTPADMIPPA